MLARLLHVSAAAVNQWVSGVRPVPARHCSAIEQATKGAVTRKDLRPKDWADYWPELAQAKDLDKPRRTKKGAIHG